MYAVIETGGKQYRVEVGTELEVELLEAAPGDAITLDRVLLVADGDTAAIGRPLVDGATVAAEVVDRHRGDKVIAFKYRPKARRRVKKGHRQELTLLRISDIVHGGRSAAADAKKAAEAKITERQRLEEAARRQAEADAALAAKLKPAAPKSEAVTAPASSKADKPAGRTKSAATKATGDKPAAKAETTKADAAKAESATKTTKPKAAKGPSEATGAATEKPARSRTKKDE